jgi:hypothetical protein
MSGSQFARSHLLLLFLRNTHTLSTRVCRIEFDWTSWVIIEITTNKSSSGLLLSRCQPVESTCVGSILLLLNPLDLPWTTTIVILAVGLVIRHRVLFNYKLVVSAVSTQLLHPSLVRSTLGLNLRNHLATITFVAGCWLSGLVIARWRLLVDLHDLGLLLESCIGSRVEPSSHIGANRIGILQRMDSLVWLTIIWLSVDGRNTVWNTHRNFVLVGDGTIFVELLLKLGYTLHSCSSWKNDAVTSFLCWLLPT